MQSLIMRPAVAMIELIFSIVVMGIALMSAPMLLSTASQSTSVTLQQEGINEASTRINMILTYPWDQNDDTNDTCIPPMLHVNNGDFELEANATTARRMGVPLTTNSHTFKCASDEYNASAIGKEDNTTNDLDDFDGSSITLSLESGGSGGEDYLEQNTVKIATDISYIDDNASYNNPVTYYTPGGGASGSGTTTNIKQITVTLTSTHSASELQKTIILRAFSCNIGGFEYAKRVLP